MSEQEFKESEARHKQIVKSIQNEIDYLKEHLRSFPDDTEAQTELSEIEARIRAIDSPGQTTMF